MREQYDQATAAVGFIIAAAIIATILLIYLLVTHFLG